MKITIRPAPHSKGCAHVGRTWCSKFDDQPLRCETECPEGRCCEMKHCWEVGEKLRDILIARGHEVKMGDKKYRKASTEEKASANRRADMDQLMAWNPDLHIALHTNSLDDKSVQGVRIGYPMIEKNAGEDCRVAQSMTLAELVAAENKKIYHTPKKVKTCTYTFSELNWPVCPAIYIEGCFANSNKQDGDWWHENMDAIALAYADGIEKWSEEMEKMSYQAFVKTNEGNGASIWADNKKSKRVEKCPDGTVLTVTGEADSKGFVPVVHNGNRGVFDGQYLVRVQEQDESLYNKLMHIRVLLDEAIQMSKT